MQKTENDPADTDCVISAANYLEISEFAIFQKAYTAWFGTHAQEKQMEKIFALYILRNKVPYWVRNYARSQVSDRIACADQSSGFSKTANNLLYLATIVAEYVLLASYLVMR